MLDTERSVAEKEEAEQMATMVQRNAAAAKDGGVVGGVVAKEPWTEDELTLLVKAANKFPGGVPDRWERMAELINHFANPCHNRSADEVTAKVKERRRELEAKRSAVAAEKNDRFSQAKLAATTPVPPPTPPPKAPPKPPATLPPTAAAPPAPAERPSAPPAEGAAAVAVKAEWSSEQQKALETALQKVPASVGPDRWDRIAELVPGKTKGECVKRFKEIVAALKAKKAAGSAA